MVCFPVSYSLITCQHEGKPRVGKFLSNAIDVVKRRPRQHYLGKQCEWRVRVKHVNNAYVITDVEECHSGHAFLANPHAHKLATEQFDHYIREYCARFRVPNAEVRERIHKDTGKRPQFQQIYNWRRLALKETEESDIKDTLDRLIREHEADEGSTLRTFTEEGSDNVVNITFWQSSEMKKAFEDHGSLLMIDGTYSLTDCRFVLGPMVVIDSHNRLS
jgi:hypothetical protein